MSKNTINAESQRVAEFMELCAPCQRRLYAYIVIMAGDTTAAHDILQDTNLLLWQKFEQFQIGTNFFAFAKEVARHRVLRYRQIHSRDAILLEPETLELLARTIVADEPDREAAYQQALAGCVGKLNSSDADLIRRRYEPGFSVRILAQRVGRSENALSQSLARIRRALRKCIERSLVDQGLEFTS